MKKLLLFAAVVALLTSGIVSAIGQTERAAVPALPSRAEPGISPDGSTIAFVSGGDIWEVAARGGDARLLVSHPATESRPLFSPDAARVAFSSTRTGGGDVYAVSLATGDLTRLTFDDANELVTGWSADGKWVYFSSNSHELSGVFDVYRVSAEGGTPMPVAADRYTTEYFASPSPAGGVVAITARANAGSQWWRKGHSHLDESEIWLVREGGADTSQPRYEQVTKGGSKDAWPMWAAGGKGLYFMSDRSGAQNIWSLSSLDLARETRRPVLDTREDHGPSVSASGGGAPRGSNQGAAKAVTTFTDGRVLWPSISKDGRTIAFERDFGIWTVDTSTGRSREVPVVLRGAPAATGVEHRTFTDQIQELAISPDGLKAAFTVHGEIFSTPAKDGGDAARVTATAGEEAELAWAPDSRHLAYMSNRTGTHQLFVYDFTTGKETQVTTGSARNDMPRYSPDGKWIAFERNSRELRVVDPVTKEEKLLATGVFDTPPFIDSRDFTWSPDSKYIAYLTAGTKAFANVYVVPTSGGEARAVSFLANTNSGALSWSPDGTYLTFSTSQRTEPGDVVRVDLVPRTPKFREDQFRDLFRDQQPKPTTPNPPGPPDLPAPPAPGVSRGRPVDLVFDDIRRRASTLPVGVDVFRQEISPDGKWLLLTASAAGQQNLYVYPIDELSKEPAIARQLTSTPGPKRSAHFTSDSKEVYYLDRGRVFNVTLERREPKAVAVTAALDVDFAREKLEAFHQAWTYLRDQFFDEKMNGVDWNAVRTIYEPRVAGARTPDEMRRIVSLMLGELNASHMGITPPAQPGQTTLGRLAVDFDRTEYESSGRLRVAAVVPLGPAAIGGVKAGDYVQQVDGRAVTAGVNLDALLDHTIGKRIALAVVSSPGGAPREVAVKPIDQQTERGLRYREWVEQKRAYVAKASGGRLGYVHMFDMSAGALSQLHLDLDADNHARQGVVVDVRNNNGGFVNVYAIDVFARRGYFNMLSRGYPSVSSRTLLGQRALELPTILVTNQHSLSDAEDFTEGYRTLKLGKVVGEPTAGWIIYTGSVTLVDGSILRMPGTKIFASDGTPMEMHPRPVDVAIKRPVGESYTGKDIQLDTAVAELLKQIGTATRTTAGSR